MTDVVGMLGNHSIKMLKIAFKLMKLTWYEGCSLHFLWNVWFPPLFQLFLSPCSSRRSKIWILGTFLMISVGQSSMLEASEYTFRGFLVCFCLLESLFPSLITNSQF